MSDLSESESDGGGGGGGAGCHAPGCTRKEGSVGGACVKQ